VRDPRTSFSQETIHLEAILPNRDFIEACYGRSVQRRPIWIMRQAGRYQASYRAVRERFSFEQVCTTPEIACQVTLQPIKEFDLDAAIVFSDILVVFPPMGLPVHFGDGGPKIARPVRSASDAAGLRSLDPEAGLGFVMEAIRMIRRDLPQSIPLIGFSGAPFTLACYAIEGTTSREFTVAREFFFREPEAARGLMSHLADSVADYLNAQIDAGADAVQIFDSWGGLLSPEDYRNWVLPHMRTIVERVRRPGIPIICYLNGTSHLIDILNDTKSDVISVDWRTDMTQAATTCVNQTALQGNLDPVALFSSSDEIRRRAQSIMRQMDATAKGHVFNLGHGILPTTPEKNVHALVHIVHSTLPKNQHV
jgi:uroporphyrinogen decarboxylase